MEQLIQMGESERVEFKREIPPQREQIAIGATAFANRRGGRIFIGVADDCSIFGCKIDKPKDVITQILRSYCDPPLDVVIDEVQIRSLPVVIVTVPEGRDNHMRLRIGSIHKNWSHETSCDKVRVGRNVRRKTLPR